MKKNLILLAILGVLVQLGLSQSLVRLPLSLDNQNNYHIVFMAKDHCLALVNYTERKTMQFDNSKAYLLEGQIDKKNREYFAVHVLGAKDKKSIAQLDFSNCGVVLDQFENIVIVKSSVNQIQAHTPVPVQVEKISFSRLSAVAQSLTLTPKQKPVREDPQIRAMIDKVSADTCARMLRDLCGMYNRNARNEQWNDGCLVPYLKAKFEAYCDSVYLQPIPRFEAPNVIGIKIGKKYPNKKAFCLVGAHIDNIRNDDRTGAHRHHGAYDNGCGDVCFLEAARVMKDHDFENTVVFIGFNVEEHGIIGSKVFVDWMKEEGYKVIGGALTHDMLGIAPGNATSIAHTICTQNDGGEEFARQMEALGREYGYLVKVSRSTSTSLPTDTKHFWQNNIVASCGKGGKGGGQYHTAADSITDIFDSTWLANSIIPDVATLAHYAVPIASPIINGNVKHGMQALVTTREIAPNVFRIRFESTKMTKEISARIYTAKGTLVNTIPLVYTEQSFYEGEWNSKHSKQRSSGAGMYLITINTEQGSVISKVVLRY